MSKPLHHYESTSLNWRELIKQNQRRTYLVMAFFMLTYACIGLVLDVGLLMSYYPNHPLSAYFKAIASLEHWPYATMVMGVIAGISISITLLFHNRLMLAGTEYREITEKNASHLQDTQLLNIVEEMKIASGLHFRPRVFVIQAGYLNAFASGFSEQSACIAVTQELLNVLTRDELQAVIAHEMAHIKHLDIRLTLVASVLANLTIMILDVVIRFTQPSPYRRSNTKDNQKNSGLAAIYIILIVLRVLLPIINMLALLYLSRTREYMADAGAVQFTRDNSPLARALLKIHSHHQEHGTEAYQQNQHESVRKQAYIYYPSIQGLFSTHPKLDDRLRALGYQKKNDAAS